MNDAHRVAEHHLNMASLMEAALVRDGITSAQRASFERARAVALAACAGAADDYVASLDAAAREERISRLEAEVSRLRSDA